MKKIYLIQYEEIIDCETSNDVQAFENKKDAQKEFNKLKKQINKDYDFENLEWDVEESDDEFCAYPDGEYLDSHILLTLKELDLK